MNAKSIIGQKTKHHQTIVGNLERCQDFDNTEMKFILMILPEQERFLKSN